jgi:hypothetical protein
MSTSQTTFLSKPVSGEAVLPETFAYLRGRAKRQAYDLVIREFKKSGISKTELARRLGKTLPEVSRMLGGPANWTIATVTDLLFAISGGVPRWDIEFPLDKPRRNATRPSWLSPSDTPLMKIASTTPASNTAAPQIFGTSAKQTVSVQKQMLGYGGQLASGQ